MCGVVDGYYMLLGSLGYNLDDISIFLLLVMYFLLVLLGLYIIFRV